MIKDRVKSVPRVKVRLISS